jgi:hypothetical protein
MNRLGMTIDCGADEFEELVAFWSAALGYTRLLPDYLVDPDGVGPRLAFQIVDEPKNSKLRWHLDLYVDSLDALRPRVDELVQLGATEVRRFDETGSGYTDTFIALLDPLGNEFCVCAPHTRLDDGTELEPR